VYARAAGARREERISIRDKVIETVRHRIQVARGFPSDAQPDTDLDKDTRWFECEPAFLVHAQIQKVMVGKWLLVFPITELHVRIIDFNFSPDLLLRKI
jgi:hypothetical protein